MPVPRRIGSSTMAVPFARAAAPRAASAWGVRMRAPRAPLRRCVSSQAAAASTTTTTTTGFARVNDAAAAAPEQVDAAGLASMVDELRSTFNSGKTRDVEWRRQQLKQLLKMVEENYAAMGDVVQATHGGGKARGLGDVLGTHDGAHLALANLDAWTRDEKVPTPFVNSPTLLGSSYIRKEPKGVALIVAPWNYPIELCLGPLVSAIAAGNCVVLKPSEITADAGGLIASLVSKYLDTSAIRVVQGGIPETSALLKLKWDHIFYTGNGFVGRIVMKAAAEHLTPVTLELGGKSPVIIDKTAKMDAVINRVSQGKWFNAGQTCIAPDYILVHKDRKQEFVDGMLKWLESSYGADPKGSAYYGRVVNERHVDRVAQLLKQTKGTVLSGGLKDVDGTYFPPTLLADVSMDEPLLQEEIFGPVLPVLEIETLDDAVAVVNKVCDRPLALYIFSEDAKGTKSVLDRTLSGGVCINSTLEHILNGNLPFGGVGESGMGKSHGKHGFDEFSHQRAVFKQDTLLNKMAALPPPPIAEKIYDFLVKFLIVGLVPKAMRVPLKLLAAAALAYGVYAYLLEDLVGLAMIGCPAAGRKKQQQQQQQ